MKRIRIQGIVCGIIVISLWLLVFALHMMGDETYAIGKVKSTNNMRGLERRRDAAVKGRGPDADFNLKARGFHYGPVEMGGPVNEASTEYLDTHRDMMPMMKAAPPMKATIPVSGIPDSHYPLPPPPPPPLPYNS